MSTNIEHTLKRQFKRKVRITEILIITFLINGNILLGEEDLKKNKTSSSIIDIIIDSDGDGFLDSIELELGSDPYDKASTPEDINSSEGSYGPSGEDYFTEEVNNEVASVEKELGIKDYQTKNTILDTDGDSIGDNGDLDDDNDGYSDKDEELNGTNSLNKDSIPADADNDKLSNLIDSDDDNDGTLDNSDAFPLDPNEDTDTDQDNIGNNADTDDDNDGYSDNEEIAKDTDPLDADSYPVASGDSDGDGIDDSEEQLDGNFIDPTLEEAVKVEEGSLIVENGEIGIKTKNIGDDLNTSLYTTIEVIDKVGALATHEGSKIQLEADGEIIISEDTAGSYGMVGQLGGTVENYGKITVNGEYNVGMKAIGGKLNDDPDDGHGEGGTAIMAENSYLYISGSNNVGLQAVSGGRAVTYWETYVNEGSNNIIMQAAHEESVALNTDYMTISSDSNIGMQALLGGRIENIHQGDVWNSSIFLRASGVTGMKVEGEGSSGENDGLISIGVSDPITQDTIGMSASDGGQIYNNVSLAGGNSGSIIQDTSSGSNNIGMKGDGEGTGVYNNSQISMNSSESYGIKVENGAYAENSGSIIMSGSSSAGMYALNGAVVKNTVAGIIEVTGSGSTGMVADGTGSKAYNYGAIKVTNENGVTNESYTAEAKESTLQVDTAYMKALNGGEIYQMGTLESAGDIDVFIAPNSLMISSFSSSYLAADDFSLDGKMSVMAEGGLGDEAVVDNFITADNIEGRGNIRSASLLYDVNTTIQSFGQDEPTILSLTFTKVADIEDLVDQPWQKDLASIVDDAVFNNADGFADSNPELSTKVANATDYTSLIDGISGKTYANISKIILNNEDYFDSLMNKAYSSKRSSVSFKWGDSEDKMDNYKLVLKDISETTVGNITVVADYSESSSSSSTDVSEYDSKKGGLLLVLDRNDKGATLGYSHEDFDYEDGSEGKMDSLHLGAYIINNIWDLELKSSIGFEYNMHDVDRRIKVSELGIDEKASSDFDSYTVSIESKISRNFEISSVNVAPYVALGLALAYHEDIKESGAGIYNAEADEDTVYSTEVKTGLYINKGYNVNESLFLGVFVRPQIRYDFAHPEDTQEKLKLEGFSEYYSLDKADDRENLVSTLELGTTIGFMENLFLNGSFIMDSEQDEYFTLEVEYQF